MVDPEKLANKMLKYLREETYTGRDGPSEYRIFRSDAPELVEFMIDDKRWEWSEDSKEVVAQHGPDGSLEFFVIVVMRRRTSLREVIERRLWEMDIDPSELEKAVE